MTAAPAPQIAVYLPPTVDLVFHWRPPEPGRLVPSTFAVVWYGSGGSRATLSVAVTEDEAKVVGLEVEARTDPVTGSATLDPAVAAVVGELGDPARALELAMAQARTIFADHVGIGEAMAWQQARTMASATSARQRRVELVAQDYLDAGGGRGAIPVVMERHNISRSTASRLVRQAREQDLLPPSTRTKETDQ